MTWLSERTHHWQDWSLPALVAAKERAGGVSLVVPARNEAATVGDVVARVREALVDTVALLDEVVVIDSDSSDDTSAVAREAGAVVHRAADIRPDLGVATGKGEAMWKSLFVTSGDLVVFMDADLVDWDTHFVPGLLGPLLTDPSVDLVKGFYERPWRGDVAGSAAPDPTAPDLSASDAAAAGGGPPPVAYEGGRVTELVARPLLALRHPELAGLVQPLAGEWAVRRSVIASLPVPTGYAVELAALLDVAAARGVDGIAQVDLGRRAHRHQSLLDLGAMATQLLAAADARDPARRSRPARERVALRQFRPGAETLVPVDRVVPLAERPPAADVLAADRRATPA